jgi:hypothetical protein
MAGSAVMTAGTEAAPETCNSSPGNANLRIGIQASQEKDSHSDPPRKYAPGHTPASSLYTPLSFLRSARYVHPPAASLYTPPSRPPTASFLRRQES